MMLVSGSLSQIKHTADNGATIIEKNDKIGGGYRIVSQLGVPSGQSDIFLCQRLGKRYIAKVFRSGVVIDNETIKQVKKIKSPRIVRILDSGWFKGRYFEVYPYFERGDLTGVDKIGAELLRSVIIPFLNDALNDIHSTGMAHMDVKPSNIFIDAKENLYLGDFGISSILADESLKVTSAKGTLGYRPPESYSEVSIKSRQFDYYSFGMTLIHLWMGQNPYKDMSEMQIMAHTLDGRVPVPDTMPEDLKGLVRGLTAYDKKVRIGYEGVAAWLCGEKLPAAGASNRISGTGVVQRRYWLRNELIESGSDLVRASTMSGDMWREAVERYGQGLLDEFFSSFGDNILADLAWSKSESPECGFAFLLHQVDPRARICWNGRVLGTLEAFGNDIASYGIDSPKRVREVIETRVLKSIIQRGTGLKGFQSVTLNFEDEDEVAYYFGYAASGVAQLHYKGKIYSSMEMLVMDLAQSEEHLISSIESLGRRKDFKVWIRCLKSLK